MTKQEVVALRGRLEPMLKEIESKLGCKIDLGSCKFSDVAEFKLICSPIRQDGTVVSKEAGDYRRYHKVYGLPEDGVGRTILVNGQRWTIAGLLPKCRKFPVSVVDDKGRRMKTTTSAVLRGLSSVSS